MYIVSSPVLYAPSASSGNLSTTTTEGKFLALSKRLATSLSSAVNSPELFLTISFSALRKSPRNMCAINAGVVPPNISPSALTVSPSCLRLLLQALILASFSAICFLLALLRSLRSLPVISTVMDSPYSSKSFLVFSIASLPYLLRRFSCALRKVILSSTNFLLAGLRDPQNNCADLPPTLGKYGFELNGAPSNKSAANIFSAFLMLLLPTIMQFWNALPAAFSSLLSVSSLSISLASSVCCCL